MKAFPDFMKNPLNKVDSGSQYTPGIEGYVFDGIDGSQMAFRTYDQDAESITFSRIRRIYRCRSRPVRD